MSWWGTFAGGAFGFAVGGPLGAVVGAVLGGQIVKGLNGGFSGAGFAGNEALERGDPARVQSAFFIATFSVLGHMAKADGVVSKEEIRMAEAIMADMDLDPDQRAAAIDLFNQGKSSEFEFDALMEQFRLECARRRDLMRAFVEFQLQVALADGEYHEAEQRVIHRIAGHLHFDDQELLSIQRFVAAWREARQQWQRRGQQGHDGYAGGQRRQAQRPQPNELELAYELLGVSRNDDDATIKKAYRRLTSQHHPDKLVAKGLPEEMMQAATEKTQAIRRAYDTIMASRSA